MGFYYLLIRILKKNQPNRSIFTPWQSQGEKEGKGNGYKTGTRGQGRGCALPLLCKAEGRREGKWWDLRHCWHDTADDQQNGLLEEGGEIRLLPRLACSQEQALLLQSLGAPPQLPRASCGRISPSAQGRQVSGCWSSLIAVGAWQMPRQVSKLKWMHPAGREEREEGGGEGTGLKGT